jgi:rod shape-determining protein MreD
MIRYALLIAAVYVATVLDTALEPVFQIGQVTPDWLALVAMVWLLANKGPRRFVVAAAVGLVADLNFPGRLGIAMAWFALVGYAVARLTPKLASSHLGTQVGVTWVAVLILTLGITTSRWALGEVTANWSWLCAGSLGVASYTAGIGIVVFIMFSWLGKPAWRQATRLPGG